MSRIYFIRFGMQRHVGRFMSHDPVAFPRGEVVVVKTSRGKELGEVLAEAAGGLEAAYPVLHPAGPDVRARARLAEADRLRRLASCERLLGDGIWPLELIDVEPLLDDSRTVVYYLGPHGLDTTALGQAMRDQCGLDAVFQPIGRDEPAEEPGGCGSCGEGGGCGTGCGESGGGCSGCAVKDLVRNREAALLER